MKIKNSRIIFYFNSNVDPVGCVQRIIGSWGAVKFYKKSHRFVDYYGKTEEWSQLISNKNEVLLSFKTEGKLKQSDVFEFLFDRNPIKGISSNSCQIFLNHPKWTDFDIEKFDFIINFMGCAVAGDTSEAFFSYKDLDWNDEFRQMRIRYGKQKLDKAIPFPHPVFWLPSKSAIDSVKCVDCVIREIKEGAIVGFPQTFSMSTDSQVDFFRNLLNYYGI